MDTLKHFLEQLGINKIQSIKKFEKGQHNQSFKVMTATKTFSVRIYSYKKPSQISFELAILKKSESTKLTPQVLPFKGKYIHKFSGKYLIIYPYLQGESLIEFTPIQLQEVGRFIGKYHTLCKNFTWEKPRYQFYYLPDPKVEKMIQISKDAKLKFLHFLPEIVKELKENRLPRSFPRGPIHVDIKPENVLFYREQLSGILDFDNAFMGPFLLDIAKSMVWFGTSGKHFSFEKALYVFQGYIQEYSLSKEEKTYLYKAIKFAFLSHIFVDYYMRATKKTSQEYFEMIVGQFYQSYKSFNLSESQSNIQIERVFQQNRG